MDHTVYLHFCSNFLPFLSLAYKIVFVKSQRLLQMYDSTCLRLFGYKISSKIWWSPTIFEVMYHGRHTCNQSGGASVGNVHPASLLLTERMPQNEELNLINHEQCQLIPTPHQNSPEILLNFLKNLSIFKDDFKFNTHYDHLNNVPYIPSFNNFPLSSSSHVNSDHQDYTFVTNFSIYSSNNCVKNFPSSFNNMPAGTSQVKI